MERSTALSAQSKMFYKTAKKASPSLSLFLPDLIDQCHFCLAKLLLHCHVRRYIENAFPIFDHHVLVHIPEGQIH